MTPLEEIDRDLERWENDNDIEVRHWLRLHADGDVEYGRIVDIAFTAMQAGFLDFAVLSRSYGTLRQMAIGMPSAWYGRLLEPSTSPRATVDVDALTFEGAAVADLAALQGAAEAYHRDHPDARLVVVTVPRRVPLQSLMAALDHLRGPKCRIDVMKDEIPDDCWLWQVVLEVDPPIDLPR